MTGVVERARRRCRYRSVAGSLQVLVALTRLGVSSSRAAEGVPVSGGRVLVMGRLSVFAGSLALVGFVALAVPMAASAHVRTGLVGVDYRERVFPLGARVRAALVVRVYEGDQAIGLTVRRGHMVVVLGYLGERFLRIDAAGVAVNASSPTAAAVGLLGAAHATAGGASVWKLSARRRSAIWHDARVRELAAGVERREWTVPLIVDGRRVRLEGEISRVRAPSPWPWLALGAALVVLMVVLPYRRRGLLLRAAVVLGAGAAVGTVVTAASFALAVSASAGRWVEGANEVVFALVGLVVVTRTSTEWRAVAGGALGLLGLSVGASKVPVFLHGVVLSALPATVTRVSVMLTISAGAAAACVGLGVFFDLLERQDQFSSLSGQLRRPP
jgi:hypothetical protein